MSDTRYAVYYVPPKGSALADFGNGWLGYDLESGARLRQPALDGVDLGEVTEEPRRYGFHATLKAPFRLAAGASDADVLACAQTFAAGSRQAAAPRLALAAIAGFLALVPDGPAPDIARLAEACLRGFDALRRPPDATELERREAAGLSARQRALLAQWGYPYVLEEFRFHMTLTRRLAATERAVLEPALAQRAAPLLAAPLAITELALCRQQPGEAFRLWRRVSLAAS